MNSWLLYSCSSICRYTPMATSAVIVTKTCCLLSNPSLKQNPDISKYSKISKIAVMPT